MSYDAWGASWGTPSAWGVSWVHGATPARTRGSIDARRERLQAIQRDDEEIMTLAGLALAAMGNEHGRD